MPSEGQQHTTQTQLGLLCGYDELPERYSVSIMCASASAPPPVVMFAETS